MPTENLPLGGTRIICEKDTIEHYEASLREFFSDTLGMDYDAVLATDEACLSDFAFAGAWPGKATGKSLAQLYAQWDQWVLARIHARYGLEPGSFKTSIRLIALMALIDERAHQQLH